MVRILRRTLLQSAAALLMIFTVQATANAQSPDLIQMLTSQLGVSGEQATGGAGALFEYAKENLSAEDFATVAQGVPEMDDMLVMAPEPENSSAMGKAAGALGGFDKSLGGMAGLASSFESLGLDADMVSKFVPVVTDYIGSVSGEQAMSLLQGLF